MQGCYHQKLHAWDMADAQHAICKINLYSVRVKYICYRLPSFLYNVFGVMVMYLKVAEAVILVLVAAAAKMVDG